MAALACIQTFKLDPEGQSTSAHFLLFKYFFWINQSNPISFVLSVHFYVFATVRNDIYFPRKYYSIYSQILLTNILQILSTSVALQVTVTRPPSSMWLVSEDKNVAINSKLFFPLCGWILKKVATKFDKLCILLFLVGF